MPALLFAVALLAALLPGAAAAHPLGNFTINRYSRIEAVGRGLQITYILDMAEIPAFQEIQIIDRNGDGKIDDAERSAYLSTKIPQLLANLHLTAGGEAVPLMAQSSSVSFPDGQGGLKTLRLTAVLAAATPVESPGPLDLIYQDDNFGDRLGWKEIVVRAGPGGAIENASASSRDVSHELRDYPQDMLSSPLNVRSARFSFTPGAAAANLAGAPQPTPTGGAVSRAIGVADSAFSDLITSKSLTLPVVLLSLIAALALGSLHGLSPGHGKAIAGAYLVSSRATWKHALFLGLTTTLTHTSSVFLLGLVTLAASQWIVPERLYPVLNLVSGLIVVIIGALLLIARSHRFLAGRFMKTSHHPAAPPFSSTATTGVAQIEEGQGEREPRVAHASRATGLLPARAHAHVHTHPHDTAEQDAHRGHDHGHGHSHLPPGADGRPVTWHSLLALGISGGLLPCPSALVVLLSAISLHRLGFGLVLIVAFSAGLAATLAGIGLLLLYGRRLFQRLNAEGTLVQVLPVVSAAVIMLAGLVITATALGVRGLPQI